MKIESPFSIDDGDFRFSLVLESNSVKAHSMMVENMSDISDVIDMLKNDSELVTVLIKQMRTWKEKHK